MLSAPSRVGIAEVGCIKSYFTCNSRVNFEFHWKRWISEPWIVIKRPHILVRLWCSLPGAPHIRVLCECVGAASGYALLD